MTRYTVGLCAGLNSVGSGEWQGRVAGEWRESGGRVGGKLGGA